MQAMTGAVLVAAVLLVLAGLPKIARPDSTVIALRTIGLRFVTRTQVRALAVLEVAVGAWALVLGGVLADVAVAALYAGFSMFLAFALRPSAEGVSCGCTGKSDTPPTYAHVVLTAALTVAALAAALGGGSTGLVELLTVDQVAEPALLVGFATIGTWLGWVVLNDLPELRLLRQTSTDH